VAVEGPLGGSGSTGAHKKKDSNKDTKSSAPLQRPTGDVSIESMRTNERGSELSGLNQNKRGSDLADGDEAVGIIGETGNANAKAKATTRSKSSKRRCRLSSGNHEQDQKPTGEAGEAEVDTWHTVEIGTSGEDASVTGVDQKDGKRKNTSSSDLNRSRTVGLGVG